MAKLRILLFQFEYRMDFPPTRQKLAVALLIYPSVSTSHSHLLALIHSAVILSTI